MCSTQSFINSCFIYLFCKKKSFCPVFTYFCVTCTMYIYPNFDYTSDIYLYYIYWCSDVALYFPHLINYFPLFFLLFFPAVIKGPMHSYREAFEVNKGEGFGNSPTFGSSGKVSPHPDTSFNTVLGWLFEYLKNKNTQTTYCRCWLSVSRKKRTEKEKLISGIYFLFE